MEVRLRARVTIRAGTCLPLSQQPLLSSVLYCSLHLPPSIVESGFKAGALYPPALPILQTLGEAVREATTTAVPMSGREDKETQKTPSDSNTVTFSDGVTVEKMEDKSGGSYWSIQRPKLYREDGTEWPWRSFTVRCPSLSATLSQL